MLLIASTLLQSYFLSSDESQERFEHLKQHFEDPITEVYLLFYQAVIPAFNHFYIDYYGLYPFTPQQARIISEETSWQVCEGYCTAGCK